MDSYGEAIFPAHMNTLYKVCSVHRGIQYTGYTMSTLGDIMSTSGGYHDACGGYHEYIGWGGTMGTSGDIMSTLGDVQ